jgi:hypothetical protein
LSSKSIPREDIGERIIAAFHAFRVKAERYYVEKAPIDWNDPILFPPQLYPVLDVTTGHAALQDAQSSGGSNVVLVTPVSFYSLRLFYANRF